MMQYWYNRQIAMEMVYDNRMPAPQPQRDATFPKLPHLGIRSWPTKMVVMT